MVESEISLVVKSSSLIYINYE